MAEKSELSWAFLSLSELLRAQSIDRVNVESWKQSQSWRELEGTARRGLMTSFTSDTGKYQSTIEYQKYQKYKVEWNCHLPVFSWPRLEFGEGWGVWRAIIHPSSPEWDILEAEERKQINMHTTNSLMVPNSGLPRRNGSKFWPPPEGMVPNSGPPPKEWCIEFWPPPEGMVPNFEPKNDLKKGQICVFGSFLGPNGPFRLFSHHKLCPTGLMKE